MEKIFTNKSIWKKIVVAVLVIMAFQFITFVPMVNATEEDYGEEEGDALGWGGILLKPLMSLLVTIGDGIMEIMHSSVMGVDSALLHVDLQDDWIQGLIKVILVAVAAVALIVTLGGSAVVSGAIILAVAGTVFGVNVVPLAEQGLNNAAAAVSTIFGDNTPGDLYMPIYTYTPEEIFKGRIRLFNVDFFNSGNESIMVCYQRADEKTTDTETTATGGQMITGTHETPGEEGKCTPEEYRNLVAQAGDKGYLYSVKYYYYEDSNGKEIKTSSQDSASLLTGTISRWYVAIRNICIVAMLSILVYVGIRMMLTTISSDKAKYKEMLKDWLVGLCLLFIMHYIMAFSVTIVQKFTDMIATAVDETFYAKVLISNDGVDQNDLGGKADSDKAEKFKEAMQKEGIEGEVHDGNGNWIWYTNLMGHLRLSMQFDKTAGKYIGEAICFLVLVIYTVIFTFTYLKRLMYMAFLTIISPFVAMTYCIDKVNDGQAQGFNTWLKEYLFNLLIQPLHLMLYYILVTSAIDLSGKNVIYSLVALGFMIPAEKMLRSIFGFQKAHTPPLLGGPLGTTLLMQGFNKLTGGVVNGRRGKDGGSQGSGSSSNEDLPSRIDDAPGLGSVLAGGEEPAGESNANRTIGNVPQPEEAMTNNEQLENQEPRTPTLEDLDEEQEELDSLRDEFSGEGGQLSEEDRPDYWKMHKKGAELYNKRKLNEGMYKSGKLDLLKAHKRGTNDLRMAQDNGISPWAMNARNFYDDMFDSNRGVYNRGKIYTGASSLLHSGIGKIGAARKTIKGVKRAGQDAYRKFDANMNHVAPKHWRRAKIAGRILGAGGKRAVRTMGGIAAGTITSAPLVGAAIAGGIASGDPSKGATAVGAAVAAGSTVGRRVANTRASDIISPEVQQAIDDVDNNPMYKEQRMERHIKNLRKDEQIKRTLESLDRETARDMMDNGHFDEYVKLGYGTDRTGLQQMIASEKLINDTSRETRNINTTRAAAAVRDTYTRMGRAPREMKDKDRREWRKTHISDYSAYGDRAEAMADQTMNLAQMFYDSMPS